MASHHRILIVTVFAAAGLLAGVPASGQPTSDNLPNFWQTDGFVNAIVVTNRTAYVGGEFQYIGPASGAAGLMDAGSGSPLPGFPKLVGIVNAAVSDGSGGWYLGGAFTPASYPNLQNLVHVLADNTIDASFKPNPDAAVRALLLAPGGLWVGGEFFQIAGSQSGGAVVLDRATGRTTSRFRVQGPVYAFAADGDTVYLAGAFSSITTYQGNTPTSNARQRAGAIDQLTGDLLPWNPGCSGGSGVYAIAVAGGNVYLGGDFTQCGSKPRNAIASVNNAEGTANTWNPNAQLSGGQIATVNAIAVVDNVAYVGGSFTTIGARSRTSLAALQATGFGQAVSSWQADANGTVNFILPSGSDLFVGGAFTQIGGTIDNTAIPPVQSNGTQRRGFARLAKADGTVSVWGPQVSLLKTILFGSGAAANCAATDGFSMLLGGNFASFGGLNRSRLAAVSLDTGSATGWDPSPDFSVRALALGRSTLYVGGAFTNIGGVSRPRLAEVDLATGQPTAWDPQGGTGQYVSALALGHGTLYVAGSFQKMGGASRSGLAELDLASAAATDWDPQPGGQVSALLVSQNTIYAGGNFYSISGANRTFLALLTSDPAQANQLVKNFDAKLDGAVRSLALDADGLNLFVGGDFTRAAGQDRKGVAQVDPATGVETNPWDAQISGQGQLQVRTVVPVGVAVYVGGQFRGAGGENRGRVGSIHSVFGAAAGWDPGADAPINAIARSGEVIVIGGEFTRLGLRGLNPNPSVDGTPVSYFAAFNSLPKIEKFARNASGKYVLTVTDGDGLGTSVLVQASQSLGSPNWTTVQSLDVLGIQDPVQDSTVDPVSRYYRLQRK